MNNYNNYYNPQPQIKTAEMVLAEIDQAIKDTIQYTSVSKITATLDRLRQAGDIVDVGTGTNRRIIQLSDRYDLSLQSLFTWIFYLFRTLTNRNIVLFMASILIHLDFLSI